MRTKSSLEFSFVGKAKIQKNSKSSAAIASHSIDILFLTARMADFKSRYKCETRRNKKGVRSKENVMKKLFPVRILYSGIRFKTFV